MQPMEDVLKRLREKDQEKIRVLTDQLIKSKEENDLLKETITMLHEEIFKLKGAVRDYQFVYDD